MFVTINKVVNKIYNTGITLKENVVPVLYNLFKCIQRNFIIIDLKIDVDLFSGFSKRIVRNSDIEVKRRFERLCCDSHTEAKAHYSDEFKNNPSEITADIFLGVSKSYVVNINFIDSFDIIFTLMTREFLWEKFTDQIFLKRFREDL